MMNLMWHDIYMMRRASRGENYMCIYILTHLKINIGIDWMCSWEIMHISKHTLV